MRLNFATRKVAGRVQKRRTRKTSIIYENPSAVPHKFSHGGKMPQLDHESIEFVETGSRVLSNSRMSRITLGKAKHAGVDAPRAVAIKEYKRGNAKWNYERLSRLADRVIKSGVPHPDMRILMHEERIYIITEAMVKHGRTMLMKNAEPFAHLNFFAKEDRRLFSEALFQCRKLSQAGIHIMTGAVDEYGRKRQDAFNFIAQGKGEKDLILMDLDTLKENVGMSTREAWETSVKALRGAALSVHMDTARALMVDELIASARRRLFP
ncbi:MAG TPA: hypothetical protein VJH23_03385 [archaeon]|nr:hypothetical protein [archaeon]